MWTALHDFFSHVADLIGALLASSFAAAVSGRLAWHTRLVQRRERRLICWELVLELPVVFTTYLIGQGMADYLGMTGHVANGVVVVAAYLGPGGIQAVAMGYLRRKEDAEK